MDWWISVAANVAQIVTGVVAAYFGSRVLYRAYNRRIALESYLKRQSAIDRGLRTTLHLVSNLAMTEAQIFEAAFASKKIKTLTSVDKNTGLADTLFFVYDERASSR